MASSIRIREVRPADVNRCFEIESVCFPKDEAATKAKIRKRQRIYPQGFLVAEVDSEVVGFVNSCATDSQDLSNEDIKDFIGHDPEGANMIVLSIAVHVHRRGEGISRPLMENFIARAKALAKESVMLLCKEDMIAYYEKFDFRDAGLSQSGHGGARWHGMHLNL